jgi:hypothetical protein
MSLEEKIVEYQLINAQIKELEATKQKVYKEILKELPRNQKVVFSENFQISQHTRFTIKTSLEEARPFNATKVEEIVDKEKIKQLVLSGLLVPNVTEARYFFIKSLIEAN